jgi:hypothetical protein
LWHGLPEQWLLELIILKRMQNLWLPWQSTVMLITLSARVFHCVSWRFLPKRLFWLELIRRLSALIDVREQESSFS